MKELDLSNLLRHAFISGFQANGGTITDAINHWPEYDPEECNAYQICCASITTKIPSLRWVSNGRSMRSYSASDHRGDLYWINQSFGSDCYYFTTVRCSDGTIVYDGDDLETAKSAALGDYEIMANAKTS